MEHSGTRGGCGGEDVGLEEVVMPEAADGIIASSRLIPVEWMRSSGSATLHPRLLIGRHPWGRTRGGWTRLSYGMYVREAGCPPRRDAMNRVSHRPDGLGGAAFLPPLLRALFFNMENRLFSTARSLARKYAKIRNV